MPASWLKAFEGANGMPDGLARMQAVQPPFDHRLKGRSSWLAVARGEHRAMKLPRHEGLSAPPAAG